MTATTIFRGGRPTVFALDIPSLAQVGTFLGGLGTLLVALRGRQFIHWFVDRATLVSQRDSTQRSLDESKAREAAAQVALQGLTVTVNAIEATSKVTNERLASMERKQTAFIGYINDLVMGWNQREQIALKAGVDLRAIPLPSVPEVLKDDLE